MTENFTRNNIEKLRLQLLCSVQALLTGTIPTFEDGKIISRALHYCVCSHAPYSEQFYRLTEFIYAINSLYEKYREDTFIPDYTPENYVPEDCDIYADIPDEFRF